VIAAIHWVIEHRRDDGLNIRVLNLSYGTDSSQPYLTDPLVHAVETAWKAGIVVVVSVGNNGSGSGRVNDPASAPSAIAVGAVDGKGTWTSMDDTIPDWSSRGNATRRPDLVAPGRSIVSLRTPASLTDQDYPTARVGASRFFRGSGSSQAAAFVSGAVALLIQQRPSATPNQIKALLVNTASAIPNADPLAQGAGLVNLKNTRNVATPSVSASAQSVMPATGSGELELSRGSMHLQADGVVLTGERDIFGARFDSVAIAAAAQLGQTWSDGRWNANKWTGEELSGTTWPTVDWVAADWTGGAWTRSSWSRSSWSRSSWSGDAWTRSSWSRSSWSGEWSRSSWSSAGWGTQATAG